MPADPGATPSRRFGLIGALIVPLLAGACASVASSAPTPLRIGAIFPLSGSEAPGSSDEYLGVTLAAQMVNASGGVGGGRISLDTRALDTPGQNPAAGCEL